MKSLVLNLIIILFISPAFAQQGAKADDELLLEYYQNQRFADAADYLKKTYPEPVTDIKVLSGMAYASQMAGRLPDAEGYYQRIYDADSTKVSVLFHLGSINLQRGNNAKAEIFYKRIIAKDTTNFVVYKQMAKISFERGEQANMISYLTKANQLNPADADVASDLSDILVVFKKYDLAEKALAGATAIDPDNVELLISLLKLYSSENKYTDTKNTGVKLLKLEMRSGFVLTKLGAAYYNLKEYECCVATLADISDMEKSEVSCYLSGLAYKELKDYPMAIANFKKAIDIGISPDIASYYGEIAETNEKQSKYTKAAAAYKKGLQFTEAPIIYYLLGNLYDGKLKDKRNAILYYKKYIASKPPASKQTYVNYAMSRVEELGK